MRLTGTCSMVRAPQKGGEGIVDAAAQLVALEPDLLHLDRAQERRRVAVGIVERAGLLGTALRRLGDPLGDIGRERAVDHLVHQHQAVEGVPGIGDRTLAIGLPAIVLDIGAGQRGPAQQHRDAQALAAHLLQVLAHDHGRLDQQARHADGVGPVLRRRVQDRGQRLLDAEIDHPVAVVGQDDVDQVLADVVHVALDRGEHDRALLLALDPLHHRLEIGHGLLHGLGRLQHEGQLHLAGAEQLAHDLHAVEQDVVDDGERRHSAAAPRRVRPPGPACRRRRSAASAVPRRSRGAP